METFTEAAAYVLRFINQTNKSIFLTGKAGTGKTTLLREIIRTTHKNTVVVAPTGIAALNAGGITIHSMFQLPFAAFIPEHNLNMQFSDQVRFETKDTLRRHFRMPAAKQAVIRSMELLIIDEVSMLRADLLDAIEFTLQSIRKNSAPFGGVQVLFIGDLLQLPPVIRNEEWVILRKYYGGKFFFHSKAVQRSSPLYIELSKIFRQTDDKFISILNSLRNNTVTASDVAELNKFVKRNFDFKKNPGYITLTTHNQKADEINLAALEEIAEKEYTYFPEIVGEFPDKMYPLDPTLRLKKGAQVMFVKNDLSSEKNYYNGKTGIVKSLSEREIIVHFPEEGTSIEVERYEWKNIRYFLDPSTKEIQEETLGTFVQYPLKLAWAITVHKSQGLTFERAILDVAQVFLPGQAYVALSRLRSLEGLILLSPITMNGISNDEEVMNYSLNKADDELLELTLKNESISFIHNYIKNSFEWSDLAQEWRNHYFSYSSGEKSEKSRFKPWAKEHSEQIQQLTNPAKGFMQQIDKLFLAPNFDLQHIMDRVSAAFDYFFPKMDQLLHELLWKLEEIQRIKKAKVFYDEIVLLEDLQSKAVIRLLKAKKLMQTAADGLEICRESLQSDEILIYKTTAISKVKNSFKTEHVDLIADEEDVERYLSVKKPVKVPKKSTVLETYELWQQKNTIKEIATIRKLTVQTINSHITKLIENKTVAIFDVLPEEKVIELARAFVGYTEDTVNGLKEKHGDKFTWDELKMFKATLPNQASKQP